MDTNSSPSASTPGNLQFSAEGDIRVQASVPSPIVDSDLINSNESTILESSSMEDLSTTVQYEKELEDTTIIDCTVKTPGVYSRTRSHGESGVPPSTTNFLIEGLMGKLKNEIEVAKEQEEKREQSLAEGDMTVDDCDSFEDTQYQMGYKTDVKEAIALHGTVKDLNKSYRGIVTAETNEYQAETIIKYNNRTNAIVEKARSIEIPEGYLSTSEDIEELKGMTFIKYKADMDTALDTTMEALDEMRKVDLKKLPVEILEKLILILVTLGKQNNKRIKSNNSLIAQLDGDLFDFAGTHEKLEAIDKYSKTLVEQLSKERAENGRLAIQLNRVQEERNKQLITTLEDRNNREAILNSNMDLKDQVKELELAEKELLRSKKEYKGKYTDLKVRMKEKETELADEKTKNKHL